MTNIESVQSATNIETEYGLQRSVKHANMLKHYHSNREFCTFYILKDIPVS